MAARLEAIAFNHDPLTPQNGLNLRRDASAFVTIPEWRQGASLNPEDSIAAYAVNEARRRRPNLQVQLRRTGAVVPSVEVRAVDPAGDRNVLGSVRARRVTFLPDGRSRFETFELEGSRLHRAAVGVHTVTWRWEVRADSQQPWVPFEETSHRIYTVLSVPRQPWQQFPAMMSNTQLPWTAVLDHACRWAAGARTLDEAAERITRAVFDLGPEVVEYDCPAWGAPRYTVPYFDCSAFLDLLRGGLGRGRYVNCSDCATIVSTFANSLGCRLWQSGMGVVPFALNPIVAIGGSRWRTACDWGGFTFHEVAWKGACTENDNVYDACLLVDGDGDPTRAPHEPLLAVNLRFGEVGAGQYRDRLAAPAGRAGCEPLPAIRQHRFVA
jgi:hypothetical protein